MVKVWCLKMGAKLIIFSPNKVNDVLKNRLIPKPMIIQKIPLDSKKNFVLAYLGLSNQLKA
ncbi:MAG: hypothetical protein Roseis2KO_04610 [Roseivirga sp.]